MKKKKGGNIQKGAVRNDIHGKVREKMYKHYIAVWSVDEELKRGNKNSIHNFIDADGNKITVASKLHRVSDETAKKIWELIKAENEKGAKQ